MPSTRGMGSKIRRCCSPALSGAIAVRLISPKMSCGRSSGQRIVASSTGSPSLASCTMMRNLTGSCCDALLELVEEEVGGFRCSGRVVEIFVTGYREYAIAAVTADAVGVGELECRYREERLLGEACGDRLGDLYKGQSSGMCAEELLDGVGVRSVWISGDERVEEVEEIFRGARWEGVDGVSDDVSVDVFVEVKADDATARARVLRVIVGNGGDSGEVGEAHRYWSGRPLDVRCTGERGRLG